MGPYLWVFAYMLLNEDSRGSIAIFDALRARAQAALDPIHNNAYVDVVFTSEQRWLR